MWNLNEVTSIEYLSGHDCLAKWCRYCTGDFVRKMSAGLGLKVLNVGKHVSAETSFVLAALMHQAVGTAAAAQSLDLWIVIP